MTDGMHIPQEDLALYAMQALTPVEAAQVRAHVETCATCREELASLQGDLALLAMSVEQHEMPSGARDRFVQRLEALPHVTRTGTAQTTHDVAPRRPARWLVWVPSLLAAAMIVLALGLQTRVRTLQDEVQHQQALLEQQKSANARAQAVLNLLSTPAAQHVVLTAAKAHPAPTAKAYYLASSGALLMQASNLEPIPQNKTYELWVIPTSGTPVPAGTFRPDAAGNASVVLPELPSGIQAKAFGVTIENAGGSSAPTLPIVLAGAAPVPGE